ncbi:hypothetical protein KCMC57_up07270 [Kitasatospora sp. CMC57]|uniref:Uncharacterized protein n=1 Tax=Kitasatospora sp. CMC57 TaxID=3231513 RepID=A0AB33JYE8_9ACTN
MLEAAVATGSLAIPEKLPEPSFGTAAQAAPNGWSAAMAEALVTAAEAEAEEEADVEAVSEPLLQALRPSTRAPAANRAARDERREVCTDMGTAP